jgi:monoamine oxidase
VGGRIRTLRRTDFLKLSDAESADVALNELDRSGTLLAEAGAMRFPTSHQLVAAFVFKLKLDWQPFLNTDNNRNGLIRANGVTKRDAEFKSGTVFGYELTGKEKGHTAQKLLEYYLSEIFDRIGKDHTRPTTKLEDWQYLIRKYEKWSLGQFLHTKECSAEARDMIGVLANLGARMQASVLQNVVEIYKLVGDDQSSRYMYRISGGNDLLPQELLKECERRGAEFHPDSEFFRLTFVFHQSSLQTVSAVPNFDSIP